MMLRQLRADRLMKRQSQITDDERDAEEVTNILSEIVHTRFKPVKADATEGRVAVDEKENQNPAPKPESECLKGGSKVDGRKRGLSEIGKEDHEENKTVRVLLR